MTKDERFLELIDRRRPGKVTDVRHLLRERYGHDVHVRRPGREPSILVYHHSASPAREGVEGALASTWDYHIRSLGWHTGGYALLVDRGGGVYVAALPFGHMTYNAGPRWNPITIAVCAVGNYQEHEPTPEMLQSLYAIGLSVDDVVGGTGLPWRPHRSLRRTACPGNFLTPHVWRMTGRDYAAAELSEDPTITRPEQYP